MLCALAAAAIAISAPPSGSFGAQVSDADLAGTVAYLRPIGSPAFLDHSAIGFDRVPTGDVIDSWWADDGMLLIDEAAQPAPPTLPSLNLVTLAAGGVAIRLDMQLTAEARP